jgi:transposase-like protein
MILTKEQNAQGASGAPQWVQLTEAARHFGVSSAKLSRWVKTGRIGSRKDPRDERVTFVDMAELNQIFNPPNA